MVEVECLSIAEFAEKAGVSKQAIYKQVNNENSQLSPYIVREGKRTLIKASALVELYGVDTTETTLSTPTGDAQTTKATQKQPEGVDYSTQISTPEKGIDNPETTFSTPEYQPISADYIAFLKAQLAEVKEEKAQAEQRYNATIQEKDAIIKQQTEQLASLAQQVAQLADKALIATSQQQYLTAMEKAEKVDAIPAGEAEADPQPPAMPEQKPKKGFWSRIFGG